MVTEKDQTQFYKGNSYFSTHEEPFDMVYDTGAFVALDPSTRKK